MTEENRTLAAEQEMSRAAEELGAARALVDLQLFRPAMTRVYYAVFHAARALLFAEGLEPRSHAGLLHLLGVHYVRTGRLEPLWSRVVARLQKFREEADYGAEFVLDRAGLDEELSAAEQFCVRTRELLSSKRQGG